ncbi:hypothetical protein PV327_007796 [Microctonus hyperodae]|uniref:Uncharacterized protein n=1 Tax=Microctonus hyperodae TaxID=165561 RepID=A0AA39KZ06_MICHY|nr:hypothetical protein PV327_007796 [Microctonus hyperodae]
MLGHQIILQLLVAVLLIWKSTAANPVSYDQRQTGDVNVQIDVEDVQVVALVDREFLDDYTDYNYAYDYADFTIKPIIKPVNSTSSSTSIKPWTTWPTMSPITSSTSSSSSIADVEITSSISNSSSIATTSPSSLIVQSENVSTIVKDESNITVTTSKIDTIIKNETNHESQSENDSDVITKGLAKRCRRGTLPDGNGRCRKINRRRTSFLPRLAMKLAPKLTESAGKDLRIVSWMTPSS